MLALWVKIAQVYRAQPGGNFIKQPDSLNNELGKRTEQKDFFILTLILPSVNTVLSFSLSLTH